MCTFGHFSKRGVRSTYARIFWSLCYQVKVPKIDQFLLKSNNGLFPTVKCQMKCKKNCVLLGNYHCALHGMKVSPRRWIPVAVHCPLYFHCTNKIHVVCIAFPGSCLYAAVVFCHCLGFSCIQLQCSSISENYTFCFCC